MEYHNLEHKSAVSTPVHHRKPVLCSQLKHIPDYAGITNGIDINEWNPSSDEHIASHYSVNDLSGKVDNCMFLSISLQVHLLVTTCFASEFYDIIGS